MSPAQVSAARLRVAQFPGIDVAQAAGPVPGQPCRTRMGLATAAALFVLAGCATPMAPAPAERPPLKLTLLHTNDHHGRFWPNAEANIYKDGQRMFEPYRLQGSELLQWLAVAAGMTPGAGGFPQTAGVQLRIEGGVLLEARVQGVLVDPRREYRLAINHVTATGGDGYPRSDQHPGCINTGFVDGEVLPEYIARRSPLRAAEFAPSGEVQRK